MTTKQPQTKKINIKNASSKTCLAPGKFPEKEVYEDDKTKRRNHKDKGISSTEGAKSPIKPESLYEAMATPSLEEKNAAKKTEPGATHGTPAQKREVMSASKYTQMSTARKPSAKSTEVQVDSSEMTKDITTGAQLHPNANNTVGGARPKKPAAPAESLKEDDENDKIKIGNLTKDKGVSACERAKSTIKEVALKTEKKIADAANKKEPSQMPKQQIELTSNSKCTQKPVIEKSTHTSKVEAVKKKEKQTQEKLADDNAAEIIKTADSTTDSSEMIKDIITTGAQLQPKENGTVGGARPKRPVAPAESLKEEDDKNDERNLTRDKGVRAYERPKSPIKEVAAKNTKLRNTLEKLKIRMDEKSKAAKVINQIEKVILTHLGKTKCFKDVEEPLHTGSYYENLKISNPDEFDIMFPIPVERVNIEPFSDDGAFYSVSLKRGSSPLQKFLSESRLLPASEILLEFRNEVIKSIKEFPGVKINRKKKGCPAVTLNIEVETRLISLDIVFCLSVKSTWPPFTDDGLKIEGWLGTKVRRDQRYKPYYLVPKYEGRGTVERSGVKAKDAWRVSFSHVEKDIINKHGSKKTCCEKAGARCCRKDCLKLLKHLLSLLKNQDTCFDKFCSYHAKTTLLHACSSRTDDTQWAAADLDHCFEQLLKDFEEHLECHQLSNFFIPAQNLLSGCSKKSCKSLAQCIREQREEGFPIFNS